MVKEVSKALASGNNVIGFLVWYDCENAHVTPTSLNNLFVKHSMPQDSKGKFLDLPEAIKPKNAFQKACRLAMAKDDSSNTTRTTRTKLIVDGMGKIVYGVVDMDVNERSESIEPDFSDRVWMDKGNNTVQYDKGHPTSKKVKLIFDTLCGEYTTRDISRMIVDAMDRMAALSLRKAGVVYFVPVANEKQLIALQGVVNDIGQCNMQIFALGDDSVGGKFANKSGVTAAAKSHVNSKIEEMKADIASLKDSMVEGTLKGQSAKNSIDVRMARFHELKSKCQILADALKMKAEDLEGDLNSVETLIHEELEAAAEPEAEVA